MAKGIGSIKKAKIFNGVTILASASSTTSMIQLDDEFIDGFFSLQVEITGSGTAKFEYQLSNNNVDYITPTAASDIVTSIAATGGPGSDGKDIYSFDPMVARSMKIKCTETGGANSITVTATLVYQ